MTLHLVGTRGSVAEDFVDPATPLYDVFVTKILDDQTSLQFTWSHWYGNGVSPGVGKNLTIDAELEHPAGVFTKIKFGGANTITTGPLTNVTNDPVTPATPIASGTWVKVRAIYTGCCNLHRGPNATIGEGSVFPATGLTLTTARSAAFNANFTYTPSVVIGQTDKPSAFILGDSLDSGLGDDFSRADGSYGMAGGALNAYPWAQMVQWGGSPADYLAGAGALQAELVNCATDLVCAFGANHLFDSDTAAATLANQAAIFALYPALRQHLTTITPKTTSPVNFWSDLAGQTVTPNTPQIQIYNAAVRANAMGYAKPYDFAAVVEYLLTGKFKVNGTPYWLSVDGVHFSPHGYGLYPGAGFTLDPLGPPPVPPTPVPRRVTANGKNLFNIGGKLIRPTPL